MERPKALHLHKIPGLMPDCNEDLYHYEYRNQWADYEQTEKFYEQFPPEVGQTVVVLSTFGQVMRKPHVLEIEVIHKRGGIIVDHDYQEYAGVLFLRNGQNWKAKRSQTWLVPAELYRDIPKNKENISKRCEQLGINEMIDRIGGQDRYKESIDRIMQNGKTYPEAKKILSAELVMEQGAMDRGFIRAVTRAQNRFGKRFY